ncbi:MAG TPA: hypothetical protein VKX49_03080 [Bryobacteraceae bacterium]|nr:hypothetical protein [Bryobacteraceae bacterium]
MACAAAEVVLLWPKINELIPMASNIQANGEIGRRIREGAELARDYRGYVWSQAFRQGVTHMATLFAVLLGTGGLLSHRSGGLFLLSLPVPRRRFVLTRAAAGLGELLILAFIPSVGILLFSPAVGKSYGVADAVAHGTCLFAAAAVFFSSALLATSIFGDFWRPLLTVLCLAIILGLLESALAGQWTWGIFHIMSGEAYFRHRELPWLGLLASAAISIAMLFGATIEIERLDF